MQKNILVVGALSQELNIVKEEIKNLKLRDFKVSFLSTGIGNYNMILNLSRFLENHEFDFVVNVGVCGETSPQPSPLEEREYEIQVGRIFSISNKKELIVPYLVDFGKVESIACSEKIVYDEEELGGEKYVDMESYGFELVCDSFKIARIIIKVPVDIIGEETRNFDYEKAKNYLRKVDYSLLFEKIGKYLDKFFLEDNIKRHLEEIEKFSKNFKFTFSEKEIFKKLYFKYLALNGDNFGKFFEENKSLDKKEFLGKLK